MKLTKKIILISFVSTLLTVFLPVTFSINTSPEKDIDSRTTAHVSVNKANAFKPGDTTVVTEVLSGQQNGSKWIRTLYDTCKGLMNILLLVALLVAAFANILHIPIENYTIKKILPKVLFVVVLANLALPIITLGSRMVDSIQGIELFKPTNVNFSHLLGGGSTSVLSWIFGILGVTLAATSWGGPLLSITGIIMAAVVILGPTIIVIFFHLIMAFRPWVIFLAAAVAPLAIGCSIFPQTEQYFKKWIGIIVPWLALPIIGYALINIGQKIPFSVGVANDGPLSSIIGVIIPLAVKTGILILAIRFPFSIEKDISSLIATGMKLSAKGIGRTFGWLGAQGYAAQSTKQNEAEERGRQAEDKKRKGQIIRRLGLTNASEGDKEAAITNYFSDSRKAESHERALHKAGDIERRKLDSEDNPWYSSYKLWGLAQTYNPYGISAAIKERTEMYEKDVQKAHFRKSIITAKVLGKQANFKHQSEIQRGDLARIYNLDDLEANIGGNFNTLINNYAAINGVSNEAAKIAIHNLLTRLDAEQASKQKYVEMIGKYFKNEKNADNMLANVVEGFNRLKSLAAQAARSNKDVKKQKDATNEAMHEFYDKVSAPSGNPELDDTNDSGAAENDRQIETVMNRIMGIGSNNPPNTSDLNLSEDSINKINSGNLNSLYAQSNATLESIMSHLISRGIARETARQFIKTLKEKNGLEVIEDTGDKNLDGFVKQYNAQRLTQIAIQSSLPDSKSSEINSQMILGQLDRTQSLDDQRQKIEESCNLLIEAEQGRPVAPVEIEKARSIVGEVLSREGTTISSKDAQKLLGGSEVLFSRDSSGKTIVIDDPVKLKVRTTIQRERDIQAFELATASEDLLKTVNTRKPSGQELILPSEEVTLRQQINAVVEPHMELRYGEQWKSQTPELRDKLVGDLTSMVRGAFAGTTESLQGEIQSMARDIQSVIESAPFQVGENIGTSIPLVAEKIFQERIGNAR